MASRLMVSLLACTLLLACGEDDGTNDDGDKSTMSAGIGGGAWTANVGVTGTYGGGSLEILGTGSSSRSIRLAIPQIAQAGTYALGPDNPALLTYKEGDNTWSTAQAASDGSITVTSITASRVVGTFAATTIGLGVVGSKVITNGKFDVKF